MAARFIDDVLQGSTLSRTGRQEKETMRMDRFHSGRFSNFGQFCLFETDGTCRNKKISDPIGHNAYGAENGSLTRCSL
jgi:hypothetical protein